MPWRLNSPPFRHKFSRPSLRDDAICLAEIAGSLVPPTVASHAAISVEQCGSQCKLSRSVVFVPVIEAASRADGECLFCCSLRQWIDLFLVLGSMEWLSPSTLLIFGPKLKVCPPWLPGSDRLCVSVVAGFADDVRPILSASPVVGISAATAHPGIAGQSGRCTRWHQNPLAMI